jgi:hypothetical protein
MNRYRLSTNIKEDSLYINREELQEKVLKFVSGPSNYEIYVLLPLVVKPKARWKNFREILRSLS